MTINQLLTSGRHLRDSLRISVRGLWFRLQPGSGFVFNLTLLSSRPQEISRMKFVRVPVPRNDSPGVFCELGPARHFNVVCYLKEAIALLRAPEETAINIS